MIFCETHYDTIVKNKKQRENPKSNKKKKKKKTVTYKQMHITLLDFSAENLLKRREWKRYP